jgi:hypothetical protein
MFETDADGNKYFTSIKTIEGYTPVKCTTTSEFYILKGKTVKMTRENLSPRFGLTYAIYAPPKEGDPLSGKYYVREFRDIPDYVGYIKSLRHYILDGNLFLLFTPQEIDETRDMLRRLYKGYHKKDGVLNYKTQYLPLLEANIFREWYEKHKRAESNYKTSLMQMDKHIESLWMLQTNKSS